MTDILADLNLPQQQAVTFGDGPLLILAGAGSGKTRALTYRAAYLILEKKIPPENILLLTFTNKAAGEMKERIQKLIHNSQLDNLKIGNLPFAGTFHSFCAKVLRRDGHLLAIPANYAIYDEADQLEAIKEVLGKLHFSPREYRPAAILNAISQAKNELVSELEYPQYARGPWQKTVAQVYLDYQKFLAENEAVDFDDLIFKTVVLFKRFPEVLGKYQNQYPYLLVDEYQDTNYAQYVLTKLLARRYRNLTVVGDASQCLPPETPVITNNGPKKIKNLSKKDLVIAANGRGETHEFPVEAIHKRRYKGKLVHIFTEGGKELRLTPNHLVFASLKASPKIYWVYLMYRRDKGYRIGIAKGSRHGDKRRNIETSIGLETRGNQESADKMWIIKTCFSKEEALFWEMYYSFEYGIPSAVFETCGRKKAINQNQINMLFSVIDTKNRAKKLMNDLYINPDFPHHRPKGTSGNKQPDRQVVHLKYFEDPRKSQTSPWSAHRIALNTTDRELEKQVRANNFYTRPGRRNTWRTEITKLNYSDAYKTAQELSSAAGEIDISHEAFLLKDKKLFFHPASHLHPEMIIPIETNGKVERDLVNRVEWEDYEGFVYDIDVKHVHNYLANGIVVHNSIYGWRGANFRNLINLKTDFPDLTVINLEQNYRSTQTILNLAYSVISHNTSHPILKLWTQNQAGEKATLYEARNEVAEAEFVVNKIIQLTTVSHSYRDFAILYRTNAQSRVLEEVFLHAGIPYTLVGGTRFYQRKEIKDVLAYLRVVANPKDLVSYHRIEKLGKNRLEKFLSWLEKIRQKDEDLKRADTLFLLDNTLKATEYLDLYDPRIEEDLSRLENIKELRSVAAEFPNLSDFLENVALVEQEYLPAESAGLPNKQDKKEAVALMTLHASKGLEFPVVFLVGMEEGLFPHSRSLLDRNELEEERRLCYVGLTRAKEKIFLTHVYKRLYFGQRSSNEVSRFVQDLPEELLEITQGLQ